MSNKNNNVQAQADSCDGQTRHENLQIKFTQINTQVYPDDPSPIPQNIDNMIRTYSVYKSLDENSILRPLLTYVKQGEPELRTKSLLQCAIALQSPRAVETTRCDINPSLPRYYHSTHALSSSFATQNSP